MLRRRKNKVAPPAEGTCPLTTCMKLVGGTWTPNIIWYLRDEARRFSELKADIEGVSAKVLTERLRRLEKDGLIVRQVVPTSPPSVEYSLTDLGHELRPAIEAIAKVGAKIKKRGFEMKKAL